MRLSKDIENWLLKNTTEVILSVVAFFGIVVTTLRNVDYLNLKVAAVVRKGLDVDLQGRSVLNLSLFAYLCLLPVVLVILALLLTRAHLVLRSSRDGSLLGKTDIAKKTLEGMMVAANRIREQLFPAAPGPIEMLEAMRASYLIHSNFDTEVRLEYEIRASAGPVHFKEVGMFLENAADPVDYLDEIKFDVRDETVPTKHDVCYLPTKNDARRKSVVIFFLPHIDVGEAHPRKIVITYTWPGMFKQLAGGREMYEWAVRSVAPVPVVECSLALEPGTGYNLATQIAGPRVSNDSLSDFDRDPTRGWPGCLYRIAQAPSDTYKLEVRLTRP